MTLTETAAPAMNLDSSMVGRVIACRDVEVDFSSTALYAAAIGAEREIYLDDRTEGGAMAPPSFITSLEWPLVSGPESLAAVGIPPDSLFSRLLHLFQDSAFACPIRVGDRLTLEATLESIGETPTGGLAVLRIRTVYTRSRHLVAESWFGGYFRDMRAPIARLAQAPPAMTVHNFSGDATTRKTLSMSRGGSHIYSECARLRNPIHTRLDFATSLGLPDVALHGTLLWATVGEIVIDRHLGDRPDRLRRLATRFRCPILPNRPMTIETWLPDATADHVSLRVRDDVSGGILCDGVAEFSRAI
jgi:acyl dehydratase